jgi:hypothetical protein
MNRWMVRAAAVMAIALFTACDDDPMGGVAVDRVDVGPAQQTLAVGDSTELTAVPLAAGGDVVAGVVFWRSLNPTVATVRASGGKAVIVAKAPGVARIEAESGGQAGHAYVTVAAAAQVASVDLQPATLVVVVGQSVPVEAVARGADGQVIAGRPVTWTVSPGGRAAVTPNAAGRATVTGHTEGQAVVRATIDGITAEAELQVVTTMPQPAPEILHLYFLRQRRGIYTNQLLDVKPTLTAVGRNGAVPNPVVRWSVEDATIAVVDENGNLRGIRSGTTKVRATVGSLTATMQVTVFEPQPVPVTFDLTYDWWDGQWRTQAPVGAESWTDGDGVSHQISLWLTDGSVTLLENDRYVRRLHVKGWAMVDGVQTVVIERELVDEGSVGIIVGGETGYTMHSSTTPDLVWTLVGWYEAGHLRMRAAVGTAATADYLLRMRQ